MAEMTPMMRQYMEIKEQNKDSILFFRLGDFYEMFGDDARKASRELDLTLTTRDKDKNKSFEEKIPMCGIPYHASDAYIARLIAKGYKVAICEQTEDPAAAKGLVERDIVRIVTPGTVIDSACLEEGRSNFCAGIYLDGDYAGFSVCDISTGQTHVTAFSGPDREAHLQNELGRFAPAEAVMNAAAYDDPALTAALEERFSCRRERLAEGRFDVSDAEKKVRLQFGEAALRDLPRNESAPLLALGGLLTYLYETQKTDVKQLDKLEWYRTGQFMELDLTARRNLELTETPRSKEKKGSLLWVLDKTKTPMGGRMLRSWGVVYLANVLGAGLVAALTVAAGTFDGVYESVVATAAAKAGLPFLTALLRGVLCNFLVCIAVWMSLAAQSVPGKLAAMYLPIFTFVLCGFEHSVANMFYLPAGILAAGRYGVAAEGLSWASMWMGNLLPVTLGNILGGCLVGVVYWAVYLRRGRRA